MNFPRFLALVSLATVLIGSSFRSATAERMHNLSHTLHHNTMHAKTLLRKKTYPAKKTYNTKTANLLKPHDKHKETTSSNLCPCHLSSAQGTMCYDFMNQAVGTCHMRTCTDGFVCTSRSYATHYCFEKTKFVTKVIPMGGGRCTTQKEWLTFRVPYVDIVPRGNEREKQLNYNTLVRDDVHDMEPAACFA